MDRKLIFLDIDGTLWNSTPIVAEAWNQAVAKNSSLSVRFTPHDLTQLFGRPLDAIADIVFPTLEEKERYALIDACGEKEHQYLSASTQNLLYPGVADTIQKLSRSSSSFIVSNCQSGYIELFLEKQASPTVSPTLNVPAAQGLARDRISGWSWSGTT